MTESTRQLLINEVKLRLGDGIVDIELDKEHYDFAVTSAVERYRQRSGNALEESFIFLDTQPDVGVYTLPAEIQEVRDIYRRNIGGTAGGGATVDPFSLAFTNNMYMLGNPGGLGGGSGTLALYELASQHRELVGRLFGQHVQFTWNTVSKQLLLHRRFTASEQLMLHVYNSRPEDVLLRDPYARPWLRDYATAQCKMIMGESRSKFASLAGPQGGITLNGDALKNEAKEEFLRLEEEIKQIIDGHEGYGFIIG